MNKVADVEERFLQTVLEATATGMPVDPERWGKVVDEAEQRKGELFGELDELVLREAPKAEMPEKFTKSNKTGLVSAEDMGRRDYGSHRTHRLVPQEEGRKENSR